MKAILALIGKILDMLFSAGSGVANEAQALGATAISLGGRTVPVTALINALEELAKQDFGSVLSSLDFSNVKAFLLSQNFANDLMPVGDLLAVIGLFVPEVAIAANDVKAIALILTLVHKGIAIGAVLNLTAGSLSNNAGETQSQDVQSSVGL